MVVAKIQRILVLQTLTGAEVILTLENIFILQRIEVASLKTKYLLLLMMVLFLVSCDFTGFNSEHSLSNGQSSESVNSIVVLKSVAQEETVILSAGMSLLNKYISNPQTVGESVTIDDIDDYHEISEYSLGQLKNSLLEVFTLEAANQAVLIYYKEIDGKLYMRPSFGRNNQWEKAEYFDLGNHAYKAVIPIVNDLSLTSISYYIIISDSKVSFFDYYIDDNF
jgi:hypothetical protein